MKSIKAAYRSAKNFAFSEVFCKLRSDFGIFIGCSAQAELPSEFGSRHGEIGKDRVDAALHLTKRPGCYAGLLLCEL